MYITPWRCQLAASITSALYYRPGAQDWEFVDHEQSNGFGIRLCR